MVITKTEIKHVEALLQLLSIMEHDDRFTETIYRDDKEEIKNMCDVLDAVEKRGEQRGKQIGEQRGREAAVSKIVTLLYGQRYMVNEIARMTGETEETVADILHLFKR